MKIRVALCALTLVAASGLAACGGSDSTDSSAGGTPDSTSTPGGSSNDPSDLSSSPPESTSGGSDSDYCSALKAAKAKFSNLDQFKPAQFEDLKNTLSDIADKAPENIQAQWEVLDSKFSQLSDALENLGVDLSDLGDPSALASLDPQKLKEFQAAIKNLDGNDITKATDAISAEVKADCGIDMGS
jgi:hypothetical protein